MKRIVILLFVVVFMFLLGFSQIVFAKNITKEVNVTIYFENTSLNGVSDKNIVQENDNLIVAQTIKKVLFESKNQKILGNIIYLMFFLLLLVIIIVWKSKSIR